MKAVIAIDSFKGSMTSLEAGYAIKEGVLSAHPDAAVVVKPLADGGEGTADALVQGLGGTWRHLTVTGPMGAPIETAYGYLKDSKTAIIEMASAAGITLVPDSEKDPLRASTYGVGEMIADAISLGCRDFIVGIGGSVTNDGGTGMLRALGFSFSDENGNDIGDGAKSLQNIHKISAEGQLPGLKECTFRIACDVTNPLCGPKGATYIYGPQKGVSDEQKPLLDSYMAHYAKITADTVGKDHSETPGAGAAGGLGFAFLSFLPAILQPGIDLVLRTVGLEEELKDADIVVTGEGRMDMQTAMGKAPVGVARLAKKYSAKVVAFAGSVTSGARACNEAGIDAFFPILRGICTLEEAMDTENARRNLKETAEQVFRLITL